MNIVVKGKQIDVGDALRAHVGERLDSLFGKYFGDAIEADIVFSREAHLIRAQIAVRVGRGITMQSEAAADAPYAAFDLASDHLAKRLRRHKRRLRDHHRGPVPSEPAQQFVLAPLPDEEAGEGATAAAPAVIAEMQTEIPTLAVSEAVMRLDLADSPAMLFRNRAHGGLNMVYRRADGNIGWVDPKGNQGLVGAGNA